MPFKQDEKLVMEVIWQNLPKLPDEDHVTFDEGALEEIWLAGFVDDQKYSLQEWIKAFEPHKTPEGTFVLRKEDFFEKDKYRFQGEIKIPFEPLRINEGKYTDEGLQELIDLSIYPSCSYSRQELQKFFDEFKERYRGKDGLIRIDMMAKRDIAKLIYENPSPTRRRELLFDMLFAEQIQEIREGISPVLHATPEQAAEVQVSTFTTTLTPAEKALKGLKAVEKIKNSGATGGGDEGVRIKKVRRSRKGIRG